MTRLKITDGDLLIVTCIAGSNHEFVDKINKSFHAWLKDKGLHNVEIIVAGGGKDQLDIKVLTVNDVFESEFLGGKNG